jgi:Cu-Zn family superoxide dismutase
MIVTLGVAALAWGCAGQNESTPPADAGSATALQARAGTFVAVLRPTETYMTSGTVRFTPDAGGVKVSIQLQGLEPGEHGFHVHEFGDCSAADGTSAGGHFNPFGAPHADRLAAERHVADLGNLTADEMGAVNIEFVDPRLALPGMATDQAASILGRGVVVHGGRDDLATQPSGAAGPRVACGVIGIAAAG